MHGHSDNEKKLNNIFFDSKKYENKCQNIKFRKFQYIINSDVLAQYITVYHLGHHKFITFEFIPFPQLPHPLFQKIKTVDF